jgi:flagellin-like protein
MTKKGISPIISTVLLVAFVIVLVFVVFSWIRSGVVDPAMEQTEEKLAGQLDCLSAAIEISNVAIDGTGANIKLNVDNVGDGNIDSVTIRVLNAAGAVGIAEDKGSSTAPLGRILNIGTPYAVSPIVASANKVEVYPTVGGRLCQDQFDSTKNIASYNIASY